MCTYLIKSSANHLFFSADGPPDIRLNIKFVQDTSKYWYKPEISREQGERFNIRFHIIFWSGAKPFCHRSDHNKTQSWATLALKIHFPEKLILPSHSIENFVNIQIFCCDWYIFIVCFAWSLLLRDN